MAYNFYVSNPEVNLIYSLTQELQSYLGKQNFDLYRVYKSESTFGTKDTFYGEANIPKTDYVVIRWSDVYGFIETMPPELVNQKYGIDHKYGLILYMDYNYLSSLSSDFGEESDALIREGDWIKWESKTYEVKYANTENRIFGLANRPTQVRVECILSRVPFDEEPPPPVITNFAATPNLNGSITLSWTLPTGVTHARIVYSVDQGVPPTSYNYGIDLGLIEGETYTMDATSGISYGVDYQFSAWAYTELHGHGEYSTSYATDATNGPFNPYEYDATNLTLWIDPRRETGYSHNDIVNSPSEFAQGLVFNQSNNPKGPRWYSAANGINNNPTFNLEDNQPFVPQFAQLWPGPTNEIHSNTNGFTLATIVKPESIAYDMAVISKWEDTGGYEWKLIVDYNALGTDLFKFHISDDVSGVATGSVNSTTGAVVGTVNSVVGVWQPSTAAWIYIDDTLEASNSSLNYDSIDNSSLTNMRIGGTQNDTSSENWDGDIGLMVGYSIGLDEMNATMLAEALASIGGK